MATPKPKKTLLDLAKETPPPPPPSQSKPTSDPSSSKPPSNNKSVFTKDKESKDSKDLPQTSDASKAEDKKPTEIPESKENLKPSQKKEAEEVTPKPSQPEPPQASTDPKPSSPPENKKEDAITKPEPGPSDDQRFPMPEPAKPEEKKPEKKKGFFYKLFGKKEEKPKEDEQPAEKPKEDEQPAEKPKTDEQPAEKPMEDEQPAEKPQEPPKTAEEIPKEKIENVSPQQPAVDPQGHEDNIPKTSKDDLSDKQELKPNDDRDGDKEIQPSPEDSKYPMPLPRKDDEPQETKPPEKPVETKIETKKPEKKKVGFFGKLFGKEDEEKEEEKESTKDGKEVKAKDSKEETSGFFSGFMSKKDEDKKDNELKLEEEDKKDIKDQLEVDNDQGAAPIERTNDDEKMFKITDEEEEDEPGFVIKEIIVERPREILSMKNKPKPDIEDEFESGDAYLVTKVGIPHSKNLTVNPKLSDRFGGVLTNCERSLGIIPGRFAEHHEKKADPDAIKGIYVWGIVPRGPADKAGVRLGEWIVSINDKEVTSKNFHDIIKDAESEKKIRLKLQKVLLQYDSSARPRKSLRPPEADEAIGYPALVTDLSGNPPVNSGQRFFEDNPHCILFLKNHIRSKDLQEFDAKEDVVYYYPNIPSNNLMDFRGSFLTLQSLVPFLADSPVENTTIELNNKRMWVCHQPSNDGLLLIFLPSSRFTPGQLKQYSNDIKRLIELLFSSVENAFTNSSNHPKLDEMFSTIFLTIFFPGDDVSFNEKFNQSIFREEFIDSSACARSIIVDQNIKMQVDEHLSNFEAESFGNMSEDYYGSRKIFDILGSSFYYKGYLISSHIPYKHVQDVNTILKYSNILNHNNNEQLGHFYLWNEIFFDNKNNSMKHERTSHISIGTRHFDVYRRFESSNQRNFILVLSADGKPNKRNKRLFSCPLCDVKVHNVLHHVKDQHKVSNALKFILKHQHLKVVSNGTERRRCPICNQCFTGLHHHLALKHGLRGDELQNTIKKSVKVKFGGFKGRSSLRLKQSGDAMDMHVDEQGNISDDLLSDFSCFLESYDNIRDCSPVQRVNHIKQFLRDLNYKDVEDLKCDADIKSYFDKLLDECQLKSYASDKSVRLRKPALVLSSFTSFKCFVEFLMLRFPDTLDCLKSWMEVVYPAYIETVEKEVEAFNIEKKMFFNDNDMSYLPEIKVEKRGRKRKISDSVPASEHYLAYLQSEEIKNLEIEMRKYAESVEGNNLDVDLMVIFTSFRDHMIVRMSVENAINPRALKNFAMSSLLTSNEMDGLFYYTIPEGKISIRLVVGGELVSLFAAYLKVREMFGRQFPSCPFVFPTFDGTQMAVADTRDILSKAFKNDSLRRSITSETMRELAAQVSLNVSKEETTMITRRKARLDEPVATPRRVGRPSRKEYVEDVNDDFSNFMDASDVAMNLSDLDRVDKSLSSMYASFDLKDGKKKRMGWKQVHIDRLKELFQEAIEQREVPTLTALRNIVTSDKEFYNELLVERDIDRNNKADLTKLFYAILCRVKTFL